jgi:hypothetical protein
MKRIGMYVLSPVETERRLGEREQVAHCFATTSGDALWPDVSLLARVRITPTTSKG